MNEIRIPRRAGAAVLALVLAGCATRPAPEPTTPAPQPVLGSVVDEAPPASMPGGARRVACRRGADTSGTLFLEHQVEMWATLRSPATPVAGDTAVIAFAVDTAGMPEAGTIAVVLPAGRGVGAPLREAIAALRYSPAQFEGCRVRQQVRHVVARTLLQ